MRRVIVESPFAPQTPLPDGDCECAASCGQDVCRRCYTESVRREEAARNACYLAACLRDSLNRGEAPFASHGLYTLPGVLCDDVLEERKRGISAGFAWRSAADASVFYVDLGWSRGMRAGEEHARTVRGEIGGNIPPPYHEIEYRELGPNWDKECK